MIIKPLYTTIGVVKEFLYLHQHESKYENLCINGYLSIGSIDEGTWGSIGFSYHKDNGDLVGWILISIGRPIEILNIDNFCIIDPQYSVPIYREVMRVLLQRSNPNVPKICFGCITDSATDKIYQRLVQKRIAGVELSHTTKLAVYNSEGKVSGMSFYVIYNSKYKECDDE